MLIARIAPLGSSRFNRLSNAVKALDGLMKYKPIEWFALWIMYVAGMSAHSGFMNRFVFWDFSMWSIGLGSLIVLTIVVALFFLKNRSITFNLNASIGTQILIHIALSFILFLLGWFANPLKGIQIGFPYICGYIAVFMVYAIQIKNDKDTGQLIIKNQEKRKSYIGVALVLTIIAALIGYLLYDPVISTASAVYLPFLLVALITKHVRHIIRARFFPFFILAMFVSARFPWFLLPLAILFFLLRFYNYFRFEIIFPTFGVEYEIEKDN